MVLCGNLLKNFVEILIFSFSFGWTRIFKPRIHYNGSLTALSNYNGSTTALDNYKYFLGKIYNLIEHCFKLLQILFGQNASCKS